MKQKFAKCSKTTLLICCIICQMIHHAAAQVTLSLVVKPPYSSYLNDYRHLENRAIITLVNTTGTAMQVKLTGSLVNESNGLSIRTNTDYRPSIPISIAPHGTSTITANPGAMNLLDDVNTTTNASDNIKQDIVRTGLLPEGMYRLCIDVVDYNTNALLSAPNLGCSSFSISQAQPPTITFPMQGQTIPSDQKAVNFSWTPPMGNLAGASVKYKLVIVEVIPGQNANDAITAARDFNANNPIINKNNIIAPIYVTQPSDLPFKNGKMYAAQVIANDANNKLSLLNNGRSEIITFYYAVAPGNTTPPVVLADCDPVKLADSLKKLQDSLKSKATELAGMDITIAKTNKAIRDCQDSLKQAKKDAAAADEEFKKAKNNKKSLDAGIKSGNVKEGSDFANKINDEFKAAKKKKDDADAKVKAAEDHCASLAKTAAEEKKKKDVTLPGEIKKLEGDTKALVGLIEDCKKATDKVVPGGTGAVDTTKKDCPPPTSKHETVTKYFCVATEYFTTQPGLSMAEQKALKLGVKVIEKLPVVGKGASLARKIALACSINGIYDLWIHVEQRSQDYDNEYVCENGKWKFNGSTKVGADKFAKDLGWVRVYFGGGVGTYEINGTESDEELTAAINLAIENACK